MEGNYLSAFDVVCTVHHTVMCYQTTRCTILLINFYYSFLSALHISNESSHSSSGARHNIPIVPDCVIQYIMPCFWWWTTILVRNMYSRQKTGIKIDYKNCASRWLLTHYIRAVYIYALSLSRGDQQTSFCDFLHVHALSCFSKNCGLNWAEQNILEWTFPRNWKNSGDLRVPR